MCVGQVQMNCSECKELWTWMKEYLVDMVVVANPSGDAPQKILWEIGLEGYDGAGKDLLWRKVFAWPCFEVCRVLKDESLTSSGLRPNEVQDICALGYVQSVSCSSARGNCQYRGVFSGDGTASALSSSRSSTAAIWLSLRRLEGTRLSPWLPLKCLSFPNLQDDTEHRYWSLVGASLGSSSLKNTRPILLASKVHQKCRYERIHWWGQKIEELISRPDV